MTSFYLFSSVVLLCFPSTIFGELIISKILRGTEADTIESPAVTNFGPWGAWDKCDFGTFAHAFQLKVAPYDPGTDNTALNGVKLFCSPPGVAQEVMKEVTSSVGSFGQWGPIFNCSGEPMTGFALEAVPYKGTALRLWKSDTDDVGSIALNGYAGTVQCTNPEAKEYKDEGGSWSPIQSCAEGYAVCGIRTQIDERVTEPDKTGLNNVMMKCCNH